VTRIEHFFDLRHAVALFALHYIAAGKHQVIENGVSLGKLTEQIVALEERVVAVRGVRNYERLHHEGVFLHQIGDARAGIDDDLVGEAGVALAI
jgi:hypothetical protein